MAIWCGVENVNDKVGQDHRQKGFHYGEFCRELLEDLEVRNFVASKARIADVKDSCIKIIHRWLAKSICGTGNRHSVVNEVELNCFHRMTHGVQYDLRILMAFNSNYNMKNNKGKLFGGLYAINLEKSLVNGLKAETILRIEQLNIAT